MHGIWLTFALLSVIVVFVVVRMTVSIALIAFLMSMMVNFFSAVGIRVSVELLAVGMPVVVAMGLMGKRGKRKNGFTQKHQGELLRLSSFL